MSSKVGRKVCDPRNKVGSKCCEASASHVGGASALRGQNRKGRERPRGLPSGNWVLEKWSEALWIGGEDEVSVRCQDHGLSEARQIYLAAANPTVSREELLSLSARGPLPLAEDQNEMACASHVNQSYQRTTRWRGCKGGEAMSDCLIQVAITKWEGASFWTSAGRGCDWPGFRQAQYPVSWERDGSTVHIASMLVLPNSSWIKPNAVNAQELWACAWEGTKSSEPPSRQR
jgi:hypothetical protein